MKRSKLITHQLFNSRRQIRVLTKMARKEVCFGIGGARRRRIGIASTSPALRLTALTTSTAGFTATISKTDATALDSLIDLAMTITFALLAAAIGLSSSSGAIKILLISKRGLTSGNMGSILGSHSSKMGK